MKICLIQGKITSRGDLKCKTARLINEDDWCDYNGTGGRGKVRASCIRKETHGGWGGASHLRRTVQDAVDEVDQLLHGADKLAGQEELLVGCVEDDNRGHRDLPGGVQKEIQLFRRRRG